MNCRPPPFSAFRAIHHGFVKLIAGETALKVEAVCGPSAAKEDDMHCSDGEIFDEVQIPPGNPPPTAVARRR